MLRRLTEFFEIQLSQVQCAPSQAERERALQLASAALLVEMTRADHDIKAVEQSAVQRALKRAFSLSEAEAAELLEVAQAEVEEATSMYDFTRRLNEELDESRKVHFVELLWRVAYADGELDKYEEHLVRRVAELLYVPHTRFIQAKHRAREATG